MRTLEQVLPLLGDAYTQWKSYEGAKNDYKTEFFEHADVEVAKMGLALRMETYEAATELAAVERALLHHPGWLIDTARPHRHKAGVFEIVLKEDPALMPFSIEHDGVKYSRQISRGSVLVDDDWLQAENPELYEAVTFALPWGDRITVPVEHMPKEILALLTKYIYNARPTVRLAAPKAIKAEEENE